MFSPAFVAGTLREASRGSGRLSRDMKVKRLSPRSKRQARLKEAPISTPRKKAKRKLRMDIGIDTKVAAVMKYNELIASGMKKGKAAARPSYCMGRAH